MMPIKYWQPIALFLDRILAPLGLILWSTYEVDEDEHGMPTNVRVTRINIGRRPSLDKHMLNIRRRNMRGPA